MNRVGYVKRREKIYIGKEREDLYREGDKNIYFIIAIHGYIFTQLCIYSSVKNVLFEED